MEYWSVSIFNNHANKINDVIILLIVKESYVVE